MLGRRRLAKELLLPATIVSAVDVGELVEGNADGAGFVGPVLKARQTGTRIFAETRSVSTLSVRRAVVEPRVQAAVGYTKHRKPLTHSKQCQLLHTIKRNSDR